MKKRVFTMVLALLLVLSVAGSAWAADVNTSGGTGETELTYDVDSSFTVTIPATATPATGADLGVSGMLDVGQTLSIKISAATNYDSNKFYLVNGAQKLEYTITADVDDGGAAQPASVSFNTVFATYTAEQVHTGATCAMAFSVVTTATQGGEYTDTLTFTVTVGTA